MIILLVISAVINLILIVSLILSIKIIKINLKKLEIYEKWVLTIEDRLHKTYLRLKYIDDRQMFEKDDDVGATFTDILQLIKDIDEKTENEEDTKKEK